MNDISKLKQAKLFLEKLANGRDPISGERVNDKDIVRDSRIISCLDIAVEALEREIQEICDSNGNDKNCERKGFFITSEQTSMLTLNEGECKVSDIAKEINRVTAENGSKTMQAVWINDWLESIGMLYRNNESYTNHFSVQAQKFIYDNIETIASQHCLACDAEK